MRLDLLYTHKTAENDLNRTTETGYFQIRGQSGDFEKRRFIPQKWAGKRKN